MAIDGETVVVGVSRDDNARGTDAGAAYVFVRAGTARTEQQKLIASDAITGDFFGRSVAISGETVVVGASTDNNTGSSGAAYVFARTGTTWAEQQKLKG